MSQLSRIQIVILQVALLLPLAGLGTPAVGEEVDERLFFRFRPPDLTEYVETVTRRREQTLAGRGTVTDVSVTSRKVVIRTTTEGFELTSRPISLQTTRNGRPFPNPSLEVLTGATVKLRISRKGELLGVDGYQSLGEVESLALPPSVRDRLPSLLAPEMLEARMSTEWSGRFGAFLDREFKPGEVVRQASDLPLGGGRSVLYNTETTVVGLVPCGERRCALIEFSYSSHEKGWSEASASQAALSGPPLARVSGTGRRIIDLDTMLVVSEDLERRIHVLEGPAENRVERTLRESREYRISYEQPPWGKVRLDAGHVAALATENRSQ